MSSRQSWGTAARSTPKPTTPKRSISKRNHKSMSFPSFSSFPSIYYILYFIFSIFYFLFSILYFIFYILYFIFYILYFILYILYFIFYILYFIFYILLNNTKHLCRHITTVQILRGTASTILTAYYYKDPAKVSSLSLSFLLWYPFLLCHPLSFSLCIPFYLFFRFCICIFTLTARIYAIYVATA